MPPTIPPLLAPPLNELPPEGKALMDGNTVKPVPEEPVVPVDPELPELDELEVPELPLLDAAARGIVLKGLVNPFKRGWVIPVGVMPKAAGA
jgi:hypothetical protein